MLVPADAQRLNWSADREYFRQQELIAVLQRKVFRACLLFFRSIHENFHLAKSKFKVLIFTRFIVLCSLQASNAGVTTLISNAKANSFSSLVHAHNYEKSLHELERFFSSFNSKVPHSFHKISALKWKNIQGLFWFWWHFISYQLGRQANRDNYSLLEISQLSMMLH